MEEKIIPNALIVFYSQGGTTKQVANQIMGGLEEKGVEVTSINMLEEEKIPDSLSFDIIGIGSPTYFFQPPNKIVDYIKDLKDLTKKKFFVFVLYGTYKGKTGNFIRKMLKKKHGDEIGYFACRGADYAYGYLKVNYLFSAGHPISDELSAARNFGIEVAEKFDNEYTRPPYEKDVSLVYRYERFILNRWFNNNLYSRTFSVVMDKCTSCNKCIEACPNSNIQLDENKGIIWGRDCQLCCYCVMYCPTEAITLGASKWLMFKRLMRYNTKAAAKDPALDYEKVILENGIVKKIRIGRKKNT